MGAATRLDRRGWIVILIASAAMVGTLPGRTQGLGLITEPLLEDLQIDRVSYAVLNFWATIIGAAGAVGVGRLVDRLGVGRVLSMVALALAAAVMAMSAAASFVVLATLVTALRALGQSALSVVSLAAIGKWFTTAAAVTRAMAIYSVVMSIGFMIAFPVVGALVQAQGWRAAWLGVGVFLAGVAILGRLLPVRRAQTDDAGDAPVDDGLSWSEALRTSAFWTFAIGAALYGLIASGIGLFNESILRERGFGPDVYYQSLVVTALTALAGNFLGGWAARHLALPRLLAIALGVLALGLLALPHLTTFAHVVAWAAAMGVGGGLVIVLFFSVWPRVFGRRHLGRIQGAAQALTVLASALGPLVLAWSVERTGSYAFTFRTLAAGIAVVAVGSLLVRPTPYERLPQTADATIAAT
jgi:MFS family permease